VGAYQALPKLTVKFGEQFIRVYGDTAVNTGYYTLSYTKDGETKSIPARYSFTFVKEGTIVKSACGARYPRRVGGTAHAWIFRREGEISKAIGRSGGP
jgi:hypothetical protein